jgi:hypothetical protein
MQKAAKLLLLLLQVLKLNHQPGKDTQPYTDRLARRASQASCSSVTACCLPLH